MDTTIRRNITSQAPQRGAVLIVSLLILLVLTIIGVAAMNTSNLEEKMAGNSRAKDITFQAAESALRAGEARFETGGTWATTIPKTGGQMWAANAVNGGDFSTLSPSLWDQDSVPVNSSYGTPNPKPQYILENYSFTPDSLNPKDLAKRIGVFDFRVTARAHLNNTDTVLQSIYAKRYR